MKTIIINGTTFDNFGSNNYSCGMDLITCYPASNQLIKDVLAGKYPGVYLNPSAPCSTEFYGVYGTPEQYAQFYKRQREAQISRQVAEKVGWNFAHPDFLSIQSEVEATYKDWWEL